MRVEIELAAMRNRVEIEVARTLAIQSQVFEMKVGVDRGQFRSTARSNGEIGNAINPQATALQARKMGKVQVTPRYVDSKFICAQPINRFGELGRADGSASG